ncbi:helix-turn-helix domain-containing protein [Beduini massiliensis]|uniref:helix-turn-helix domain-containing protein n=1 Tax=Beduini massiliensis TaxID=1585974 RepID=UPI00059A7CAA|nr:helix-turn-helix transcriptional regulator [Beduini massiliensis]
MTEISQEIGRRIRTFRKMRKLTLDELALIIYKSKSTISKYEKGEISIDIETLYDIAAALSVNIEQLLYYKKQASTATYAKNVPSFFSHITQFYAYIYDGRSHQLIRCVFEILFKAESQQFKTMMYMNFKDYETYQNCENTYWGYMEHFDALTNIILTNQDSPMEKASIQILAPYLDTDTKWGLFNGFSSRPMMPIATKILISKKRLNEDDELINSLKISKEDIRLLKLYNMMSVT